MNQEKPELIRLSFIRNGGNVSAIAREMGLPRQTVHYHVRRMGLRDNAPIATGQTHAMSAEKIDLPDKGTIHRFILTSAQNNTHVHKPVWDSLVLLAEHLGAEIMVSRFTYNKQAYFQSSRVKPGTADNDPYHDLWYDPLIESYVNDKRMELAPGLVWCGEMNIIPTAVRPLSGFETYTGRSSGIFPHVKFALESVASGKSESAKFNYTTGTVTKRNYLQRKAGLRAEHHHCYGGLLVEIDELGNWWVRQLNSTEKGEIYDLDVRVYNGEVTTGNRVEAITWGDIHAASLDPDVMRVVWHEGGMLDTLRPKHQFLHDVFDMRARNHHERKNPHKMFKRYINGEDSVEDELKYTAQFLRLADRSWCKTVVVNSNHDNALIRWLRESDYKDDPVNAIFFLEAQLEMYKAIYRSDDSFMLLEWAMRRLNAPVSTRFLREDESFVICKDAAGGIECGMHGHLGVNGAKASPLGLSKMGRKANTGHTHSAAIIDGMYVAGTSSYLDMDFNVGPSSWSHSHVLTYPTGKRAVVTLWHDRWRA